MKGKPYDDSIGHVQERACTCAHTCALEGMCKIIDRYSLTKYADTSVSGLRWPLVLSWEAQLR